MTLTVNVTVTLYLRCLFDLVMINVLVILYVHSSDVRCAVPLQQSHDRRADTDCTQQTNDLDYESVWGYLCIESLCVVFMHNKVQCFSDFATKPNHTIIMVELDVETFIN